MLTEILNLLKERGAMSLKELALHFQTEIPAMEGMLDLLKAKGRIELLDIKCSQCKGCVEVKPEDAAVFQWVGGCGQAALFGGEHGEAEYCAQLRETNRRSDGV